MPSEQAGGQFSRADLRANWSNAGESTSENAIDAESTRTEHHDGECQDSQSHVEFVARMGGLGIDAVGPRDRDHRHYLVAEESESGEARPETESDTEGAPEFGD